MRLGSRRGKCDRRGKLEVAKSNLPVEIEAEAEAKFRDATDTEFELTLKLFESNSTR